MPCQLSGGVGAAPEPITNSPFEKLVTLVRRRIAVVLVGKLDYAVLELTTISLPDWLLKPDERVTVWMPHHTPSRRADSH